MNSDDSIILELLDEENTTRTYQEELLEDLGKGFKTLEIHSNNLQAFIRIDWVESESLNENEEVEIFDKNGILVETSKEVQNKLLELLK